MKTSETTKHIFAAMVQAQRTCGKLEKTGKNAHLRTSYSTLDDILRALLGPATAAGLAIMQYVDGENLATRVVHGESGEWVETQTPMMIAKRDAQGMGSAMTYARRYALSAMFALNDSQFDDDGEGAKTKAQAAVAKSSHVVTDTVSDELEAVRSLDWSDFASARVAALDILRDATDAQTKKAIIDFVQAKKDEAKNA